MKILEEHFVTKTVDYHGLTLNIPRGHCYVATDEDGSVFSFDAEPMVGIECFFHCESAHVADVDLEGMDWKTTLVKV